MPPNLAPGVPLLARLEGRIASELTRAAARRRERRRRLERYGLDAVRRPGPREQARRSPRTAGQRGGGHAPRRPREHAHHPRRP